MPPITRKSTVGQTKLLADNDVVFNFRTRVPVADVNAGLTLLPALQRLAYRIIDITLVAVGGAATTATDARILGTRAGASVALLIAAVAALTQSAVVRPGLTTVSGVSGACTVLADGGTFPTLDVNTAVTIGKTGGTMAGCTNIDVVISYVMERA